MIYVLEYYQIQSEGHGSRMHLAKEKRRLKTADLARAYAFEAMENGLFDGKRAHICCIKDQAGALICEVNADRAQERDGAC